MKPNRKVSKAEQVDILLKNPQNIKKEDLKNLVVAYRWLANHPIFLGEFTECIDSFYVIVDKKGSINNDNSKNNNTKMWWEVGAYSNVKHALKDNGKSSEKLFKVLEFEFASESYEKGIIKLAKKVFNKYGVYSKKQSEISSAYKPQDVKLTWDSLVDSDNEIKKMTKLW